MSISWRCGRRIIGGLRERERMGLPSNIHGRATSVHRSSSQAQSPSIRASIALLAPRLCSLTLSRHSQPRQNVINRCQRALSLPQFSSKRRKLIVLDAGSPLVSTRPRCLLRLLPPVCHHCRRQVAREPTRVRAQGVAHQPGPCRVPKKDCSPAEEVRWWYVQHSLLQFTRYLTTSPSPHRLQRPQVRPGSLAQVGSISHSPHMFPQYTRLNFSATRT